jgi:hypothetical protein
VTTSWSTMVRSRFRLGRVFRYLID